MYILTHILTSQPALIKLDNENICGHRCTFTIMLDMHMNFHNPIVHHIWLVDFSPTATILLVLKGKGKCIYICTFRLIWCINIFILKSILHDAGAAAGGAVGTRIIDATSAKS